MPYTLVKWLTGQWHNVIDLRIHSGYNKRVIIMTKKTKQVAVKPVAVIAPTLPPIKQSTKGVLKALGHTFPDDSLTTSGTVFTSEQAKRLEHVSFNMLDAATVHGFISFDKTAAQLETKGEILARCWWSNPKLKAEYLNSPNTGGQYSKLKVEAVGDNLWLASWDDLKTTAQLDMTDTIQLHLSYTKDEMQLDDTKGVAQRLAHGKVTRKIAAYRKAILSNKPVVEGEEPESGNTRIATPAYTKLRALMADVKERFNKIVCASDTEQVELVEIKNQMTVLVRALDKFDAHVLPKHGGGAINSTTSLFVENDIPFEANEK